MAETSRRSGMRTQGHVAIYARDGRWRRSVMNSLSAAGHSYLEAADPDELERVLRSQRFDAVALKVRDEEDASGLAESLTAARLPYHGIIVGSFSALPLIQKLEQGGTFRYIPGRVTANELTRLIEASISSGTREEGAHENGAGVHLEEVDLEEAIESAAATVYTLAKRRQQRFSTVVEGPVHTAHADRAKLRRALVALLRLVVTLAPRGARVAVEARANDEEWLIRLRASGQGARSAKHHAHALHEETDVLASASRDVNDQGGMLWVELSAGETIEICLTLPLRPPVQERQLA